MQFKLKCEKPEDIEYTMTVTMTAKEWEKVRDEIYGDKAYVGWPTSSLVAAINDLLNQARKVYSPSSAERSAHD